MVVFKLNKQYIEDLCKLFSRHIDECSSCRIYDGGVLSACSMGAALYYLVRYASGANIFSST